jgi:hypothetical protein
VNRAGFLRYGHSSQQRLGSLKVLVSLLDPQRRSVQSESLDRRIKSLLLATPRSAEPTGRGNRLFPNNIGEELLWKAQAPSLLLPFTDKKVHRLRDWGQLLGLLGNGNQITEKGLLLQRFIGKENVEAVRKGDFEAVNPFELSTVENLYFLYLLFESDGTWPFLLSRVAEVDDNLEMSGAFADKLLTLALLDLLEQPDSRALGTEILRHRDLRELAVTMALSLGIKDPRVTTASSRRGPRRQAARVRASSLQPRTNTADDQAIPRFENLVDLGFLTKEPPSLRNNARGLEARNYRLGWRYFISPLLRKWLAHAPRARHYDKQFLWNKFANAAVSTFFGSAKAVLGSGDVPAIVTLLEQEYAKVRRHIGHTPVESIALVVMIQAAAEGIVCEMATVHDLLLSIKREGRLAMHIKFASGNDIDRMFVDLRPTFFVATRSLYGIKEDK